MLDDEIEKECIQILAASDMNSYPVNSENDISCQDMIKFETINKTSNKIKRVSTDLGKDKTPNQNKISKFSSLNVIYRPPSLSVLNAIKLKTGFVTPILSSPLTYHTIPFIHADSETNV
jgi:hypothetical protein